MDKLDYFEIAKSGYRLVYYNWQSMIRLGMIPIVIILVVAVLNAILSGVIYASAHNGDIGVIWSLGLLGALLNLVSAVAIVPLLVGWHRFTYEVTQNRIPSVKLAVTKTEFVYFGYMVALAVAFGIASFIGFAIAGMLGSLILVAGMLYLIMRFAFVFPGLALGRKTDPMQSWRETAKSHIELWLMALAVVVPMVVVGIVLSTLGYAFSGMLGFGTVLMILLRVVGVAFYVAFLTAFASALTLAYKQIVD